MNKDLRSRPEVPTLQVDEGSQEAGPRRETGHFCMIHTSSGHICLFGYVCVCVHLFPPQVETRGQLLGASPLLHHMGS